MDNNQTIYLNNCKITGLAFWELDFLNNQNKLISFDIKFDFNSNFLDLFDTSINQIIKIKINKKILLFEIKQINFCGLRPYKNKIYQSINVSGILIK